jgi:predicted Rossmann fold flavoprotein
MNDHLRINIIGGGAAGFFAALAAKEANPQADVKIWERTANLLVKVRISGGGRCNVTHSCFEPRPLTQNYPRGSKELISPFTRFQPRNTVQWFEARGVTLKTEGDGRMFPITDNSETIIQCLLSECRKLGIEILTRQFIESIEKKDSHFILKMEKGESFECDSVILATGSGAHGHELAKAFGHTIQKPIPSLFTFNIPQFQLIDLAGIAVQTATVSISGEKLKQNGPLLITHWGFSGPAVLKLSAWGALTLNEKNYQTQINIDWVSDISKEDMLRSIEALKLNHPQQYFSKNNLFNIPKNLWKKFVELCGIPEDKKILDISKKDYSKFCDKLKSDVYQMHGKTTHKEEFVTCGGVTRSEIDFKTMESKLTPGLFFAGELIDIDAVTGGFNFQNAWTTGFIAGVSSVNNASC